MRFHCQARVLLLLIFLGIGKAHGQESYTLSGRITDADNGETLFGASVFLQGTDTGAITNEYGFYSLSAPKGDYTLIISYIGFAPKSQELSLDRNIQLDLELQAASTQLQEVVVAADEAETNTLRKAEMSVSQLSVQTIKQIPVVLGEVDLIKSIQLLPGVTNTGEGSSGFNVRGGAVDQNLVLLDEAIIYNTSHLLGFVSVFNADAIKDIKLYKGGIPPRFGGRVSSVLDVRQKDGNRKRFGMSGGIGTLSSRLALEGPLFNQKGSFLVAGRASYANLFLLAAGDENRVGFYDLNLKGNYELGTRDKLYLSGYFGRDTFSFGDSFATAYGNLSGNLRWNHIFSDKLFSNLSAIFSEYDYDLDITVAEFNWISSIENYNVKYDFKYYASEDFKLNFGLGSIYYHFDPGQIVATTETSSINTMELDSKRAWEHGVYINADHQLTPKLNAQYGFRVSAFSRMGGQPLTDYANDMPVVYNSTLGIYERGTPEGEIYYEKGDAIKRFANWEPRLALAYQLSDHSSVKAGYSRTAQYIHLLSNTTSVTPLDVWTPSGRYIQPQLSDQVALGYYQEIGDMYSLEGEVYYKTVDNRIDYIDGSDLIGNNTIETEILNGESKAYGLEILLRKNKGAFTGWLAYTLAGSWQRTLGGSAGGPGINGGDWYRTPYDRIHDLSLTGAYALSDRWQFAANFVFQTGRPVTYPNGQYEYLGQSIASYSDRNANRLPDYHRLDLSANFTPRKNQGRKWQGEWVFGIYNVYNRKNAASISFEQNVNTGANEAVKTAIFGIVPSVTYNFKF